MGHIAIASDVHKKQMSFAFNIGKKVISAMNALMKEESSSIDLLAKSFQKGEWNSNIKDCRKCFLKIYLLHHLKTIFIYIDKSSLKRHELMGQTG